MLHVRDIIPDLRDISGNPPHNLIVLSMLKLSIRRQIMSVRLECPSKLRI